MSGKPPHREENSKDNVNLPLIISKPLLLQKVTQSEDLKKWEKEVADTMGFSLKPNQSASYSLTEGSSELKDADIEPLINPEGVTEDIRPAPIIITLQGNRTEVIETNEELKQWEDKMKKMLGVDEISLQKVGSEVNRGYKGFETQTYCGSWPYRYPCDSDQELLVDINRW
jgi:hypothetical protein